ncbi:MAG: molybdopterin-guanine dinucleotide biosynthesis protein B [Eggerthellaceae bacterium]|nr:molybdopterin-guanine dinucleotide biosynthesis protein B [Eggerthellaceae bacterium]
MTEVPSPAVAIVGRHNSGKTTLVVKLISALTERGHDVGSVKHHSHDKFQIDYPGKDSYRQREAGATETVIASPSKMARVKTLQHEVECSEIVRSMPGHDIIIVEGYRKSGLPTIEVMRSGNEADSAVAKVFLEDAKAGVPLTSDPVQRSRGEGQFARDVAEKMPDANTVAVVTDIPEALEAASIHGIPAFGLDDIPELTAFLEERYVRPRVTVTIQAGGESRRMGRSKATVPFAGKPLICRLVRRLLPVADEMIITTNEPENLGFLADEFPGVDIKLVRDAYDFRGALPGIFTALDAAQNPYVALVACDMVFASAPLVVAEAIEMADKEADIVVPVNKHGFEPFHAMYRRVPCLEVVTEALGRGESRAQSIYRSGELKVVEFPQERVLEVEPMGGCFVNANTPEELAHLEANYFGDA